MLRRILHPEWECCCGSSTLSGSAAGWWKFEIFVVIHLKSTKVLLAKSALAVLLAKKFLFRGAAGKSQH